MRTLFLLLLLSITTAHRAFGEVPELGAVYIGVSYTTVKNNFPETKAGLLPGDKLSGSFIIPYTSLQYDFENSWHEWRLTPIYWDITALFAKKDSDIEHALFTSGLLGHYIYGRNFFHGERWRAGFGSGLGEYIIGTESLEAGYYLTWDLAAKADVLLTDSFVGRFRARYDISVGSQTDAENSATKNKKRPHFISLDFTLLTSSKWYLGIEYWKILPRNSKADQQTHFDRRIAHLYQAFRNIDPPDTSPELAASRIFLSIGLKFHSVDSW